MDRRNFFRTAAAGALTTLLPSRLLRSQLHSDQDPLLQRLASAADDYHPYDDELFEAAERIVYSPLLREARLNDDYVNMYLYELQYDPNFLPDPSAESGKMMSGFCLASTIHQVLENPRPDFILILGDSTGIGASYKWKGLGLKDPMSGLTSQDRDDISKL